jgi:molybdenum cofactor cytidylyltransferase
MHWTGIILAAGGSTRMGSPKALLEWSGQPLIRAHCTAIAAAGGAVIVVLGAEAERIQGVLPGGVDVRLNPEWSSTQMADSLRIGLEAVEGAALITPVDVPPAPLPIIAELIASPAPAVLSHRGVDGHPVWVDASQTRESLLSLPLNHILSDVPRLDTEWTGCIRSWNTPSEWAAQS